MNNTLIQGPNNLTGEDVRQLLLSTLGGREDDGTWHDSVDVTIPRAGIAPGTNGATGKQICQLLYSGTQAELESALQDASLLQYIVVGFQSFDGSVVTTAIETGVLVYLSDRAGQTKNVNWLPSYQGAAEWTSA